MTMRVVTTDDGWKCSVTHRVEHVEITLSDPNSGGRMVRLTPEQAEILIPALRKDIFGDPDRWETGIRNIVTALIGPRETFEIPEIVERVKKLIAFEKEHRQVEVAAAAAPAREPLRYRGDRANCPYCIPRTVGCRPDCEPGDHVNRCPEQLNQRVHEHVPPEVKV